MNMTEVILIIKRKKINFKYTFYGFEEVFELG